jgi:hypothetical protein
MSKISIKTNAVFLLTFLILFLLLFADGYTANHITHDCSGVDCLICSEIQAADSAKQQINSFIPIIFLFLFVFLVIKMKLITHQILFFHIPVKMKVRLNN